MEIIGIMWNMFWFVFYFYEESSCGFNGIDLNFIEFCIIYFLNVLKMLVNIYFFFFVIEEGNLLVEEGYLVML